MMIQQRPEDDRRDAVGVGLADLQLGVLERLAERVQRARADVAIDDPERPERECNRSPVAADRAVLDGRHGREATRTRRVESVPMIRLL